jgi:hypothetical protein
MRDRAATTELGMGASERRAQQESKVLGTPRRNEPRAALARPRQAAASSRTAGSGLRVVYGRVRHARSEGGQGAVAGVGLAADAAVTIPRLAVKACAADHIL